MPGITSVGSLTSWWITSVGSSLPITSWTVVNSFAPNKTALYSNSLISVTAQKYLFPSTLSLLIPKPHNSFYFYKFFLILILGFLIPSTCYQNKLQNFRQNLQYSIGKRRCLPYKWPYPLWTVVYRLFKYLSRME